MHLETACEYTALDFREHRHGKPFTRCQANNKRIEFNAVRTLGAVLLLASCCRIVGDSVPSPSNQSRPDFHHIADIYRHGTGNTYAEGIGNTIHRVSLEQRTVAKLRDGLIVESCRVLQSRTRVQGKKPAAEFRLTKDRNVDC